MVLASLTNWLYYVADVWPGPPGSRCGPSTADHWHHDDFKRLATVASSFAWRSSNLKSALNLPVKLRVRGKSWPLVIIMVSKTVVIRLAVTLARARLRLFHWQERVMIFLRSILKTLQTWHRERPRYQKMSSTKMNNLLIEKKMLLLWVLQRWVSAKAAQK